MDTPQQQRLGVSWVLRQAAVLAVLALTALHVAGVTYLTLTQRRLACAAQKAAAEATLPKASLAGIERHALRLLSGQGLAATVSVSVHRRGKLTLGVLCSGDHVAVDVATPAKPALPFVLARLTPWLAGEEIVAGAEAVVP